MADSKFKPYTHYMHDTPTYRSWSGMIQRCTNHKATAYEQYGGRGIKVSKRWMVFSAFLADMGARRPGTTLDRINADGNYERSNCRWATRQTQQRNRRDCRKYRLNGRSLTLQEWSERTGIPFDALRRRYKLGWPAEIALTTSSSKHNSVLRKSRTHTRDSAGRFA